MWQTTTVMEVRTKLALYFVVLSFITVEKTLCTKVLFITRVYLSGFRPTIPNHPVWRTLSRHSEYSSENNRQHVV
jgi:hypothetical protein